MKHTNKIHTLPPVAYLEKQMHCKEPLKSTTTVAPAFAMRYIP